MFTESFPFGTSEPFLETEVRYLSDKFRRLVVVPHRAEGPARSLPPAVTADLSLSREPKVNRKRRLACVAHGLLVRELAAYPRKLLHWHAFKKTVSYLVETETIFRWLQGFVKSLPNTAQSLFYTYWLSPTSLAIALTKREYPKLKLVSRAHGWDLYDERHRGEHLPFRNPLLSRLDALFLISEHGRHYISKKYPKFKTRYHVSRLGVLDPGFTTARSKDRTFRIASCSFLLPVKRVELLIEGLAHFAHLQPDTAVEWHHIGDGPLEGVLKRHARLCLPPSVRYIFHGHLSKENVIDFYRTHCVDLFINVSALEGVPVSIMEAQSCGIPVIAPTVGGIAEIVNDDNGVLLPATPTPDDIAQGLKQIIASDWETASRKRASKLTWKSMYNADTNYRVFSEDIVRAFGQ